MCSPFIFITIIDVLIVIVFIVAIMVRDQPAGKCLSESVTTPLHHTVVFLRKTFLLRVVSLKKSPPESGISKKKLSFISKTAKYLSLIGIQEAILTICSLINFRHLPN